jgi:copper chaperone CopZ
MNYKTRMTTEFTINGMTCNGCRTTVEEILSKVEGVSQAIVILETETATIHSNNEIKLDELVRALAQKPKFTILKKETIVPLIENPEIKKSWLATYFPLLLIVAFISGISLITSYQNETIKWMSFMNSFMAGFFIVFSFFKLLNLKGFASSYAMYDILAKKIPVYGFIYPFIELGLGLAYLINYNPKLINTITLIVLTISIIGVIESNLNKRKIKCACLGSVFNLPMSTVTIIEDLVMILMALFMIFS